MMFTGDSDNRSPGTPLAFDLVAPAPTIELLTFEDPLDTSWTTPEYPLVSRALLLQGGSSDVVLDDMNGDGLTDLIVSVYDALMISIFYRQLDGTFKTYPSLNITTLYHPCEVRTADIYATGDRHIVTLESNPVFSDTRLVIYNLTSETTYVRWLDKTTYANGVAFAVGEYSGDVYPDLAVVCQGSSPETIVGKLQIFFGPIFSSFEMMNAGLGARSIAAADMDDDTEIEIAVGNYYSKSVMVFERPFLSGDPPAQTLAVVGKPTGMAGALFDGDSYVDLAVAYEGPDAIGFYYQSLGTLPTAEDSNISTPNAPSSIVAGDIDVDGRVDLLVLSESANTSFGYYQRSSSPIWEAPPEFLFPTNGIPRGAVIADLDGDGLVDLGVAAADDDWGGSTMSLYPSRSPTYSNSNSTTWTRAGADPTMLETGDFNGDDIVDLVLINSNDSSVDYIESFSSAPVAAALGFPPAKAVVADFNKDGYSDLVVTMVQGSSIALMMGSGSFPGAPTILSAGGSSTDIDIGDFNHDSFMDFVVSTGEGALDFFFNDRTALPFGAPYEILPSGGAGIWDIATGDFNSDGLDDLAYTRPIRKVAILLQSLTVPFGPSSPTIILSHSVGADFTAIWAGDLTGDGRMDIAAMRPFDTGIYLFDQEDFGTSPHPYGTLSLPSFPVFVSVLDATDDGPADVLAIYDDVSVLFLYRQEAGGLPSSPSMAFLPGAGASYAAIGDGTNDHRGDLLVINQGSDCISIWQQNNFPPIADTGGPYNTRQGRAHQFNGSAITGTSEIPFMDYRWDFGDGNVTGWLREPRPVHTYLEVGNYSLGLEVRDPAGLTSFDSSYVFVQDSYPEVMFSWSPEDIDEGRLVVFTDETSSYDPVVARAWTVDSSGAGFNSTVSLEFQNGTHNISLEVMDSDGSVGYLEQWVVVGSVPPELRIVAPASTTEGQATMFTVLVDEWRETPVDPIVLYEWDFSYVEGNFAPDIVDTDDPNASWVFSTTSYSNLHRVAVRATDSDGEASLVTWDILVFDTTPVAGIALSDPDPKEGEPLRFISTSTSFDGIVNWTWTLTYPGGASEVYYIPGDVMAVRSFDDLDDGDYRIGLTVRESDGNTSSSSVDFHVAEEAPLTGLFSEPDPVCEGYYHEFYEITFQANVTSFDPVVLYEWDFDSEGSEFVADAVTATSRTDFAYPAVGLYEARVRATDLDGSSSVASIAVEIRNLPMVSKLYESVTVAKDPLNTSIVNFEFSYLLKYYPDIISIDFDFGDGESISLPPVEGVNVTHAYASEADYVLKLTVADDDGYAHEMEGVLAMIRPTIELLGLEPDAVIHRGVPLLFLIKAGSTSVQMVKYSINGEPDEEFTTLYRLDTSDWPDGKYNIHLFAVDAAFNIASYKVTIWVDHMPPSVLFSVNRPKVFGGDHLNITVRAYDENMNSSGVKLFVMLPGDRTYLEYPVLEHSYGQYYRVFEVPMSEGTVEFYANVSDRGGNMIQTEVFTLQVRLHFIDVFWPYITLAAVLGSLGTAGYFTREVRNAIDEAFVIYGDGRMIFHGTRRLKPSMDDQILGSMLVAVQDFVKDSFKDVTSFSLRRIEFGQKSILIERGQHLFLAVLLHGSARRKIAVKMERVVKEIESKFGKHLDKWDGDYDSMRGIGDVVSRLYSMKPVLPEWLERRT